MRRVRTLQVPPVVAAIGHVFLKSGQHAGAVRGTVLTSDNGTTYDLARAGPSAVTWFGDVSGDDCTDVLQAALDDSNYVYLDEGIYNFSGQLNVRSGTRIDGAGRTSVLNYTGNGTAIRHVNPTGTDTAQMVWSDFVLRGGPQSRVGIELVNACGVTLFNVYVNGQSSGFSDAGFRMTCSQSLNCAQITATGGSRFSQCAGDGVQVFYDPESPGAAVGGIKIAECLIDQCTNGFNGDAGIVGRAGEITVSSCTIQGNSRSDITGSFLRGVIKECHLEHGGPPMSSGTHVLVGEGQQVYSLAIEHNIISGQVGGQERCVDISPTGPTKWNVKIDNNFLNRASVEGIRVSGVQGVYVGIQYYGNMPRRYTLQNCFAVYEHDWQGQ